MPSDTSDGASAVLSSDCSADAGNQVVSTPGGLLQLIDVNMCLQPALGVALEGRQLLVNSSCLGVPQEQFVFSPAPSEKTIDPAPFNMSGCP